MASDLYHLDHRGGRPPINDRHLTQLTELLHGLGASARLAGPTAAAISGFDTYRLGPPFHFLVPRECKSRQRVGHVVHTTTVLPAIDCEEAWGLAVTSPTRTLIDLAAYTPAPRLTAALDGALRDRLTTEAFLHSRIVDLRGRGRYGIPTLLAVIEGVEATRGGHSWLERRFLELIAQHGLPRPQAQAVLGKRDGRLIRVDCHFPATRIVVELLGYRYHRTALQMQDDAARLNQLQLGGYLVLQFAYDDVVTRPQHVIEMVAAALRAARAA